MSKPKRIQRKRSAGWRMPANAVYVGRPTMWGNPWIMEQAREAGYDGTDAALRRWCADLYREWVTRAPHSVTCMLKDSDVKLAKIDQMLPTLRGKDLACWCPLDQPCHADVLLELANAERTT